jgi:hypothetical protein
VNGLELDLPPIPEAERTPLVETLLGIIDLLHQRVHALEETVQQLRDEIAVLKGQSPRPKIAPSQLPQSDKPARDPLSKRPGSAKRSPKASFLTPLEVRIPFPDRPRGAVSNGYEEYLVQELVLEAKVTRYLRERILLPDGSSRLAPLPDAVLPGLHFGPGLLGFILYQHNQCNVTQGKLLEQLHELGIDISAGERSRLLTENHDQFHQEKAAVLQAGLQASAYVGVDDTGARHQGKNGYCTALGNDRFAYFASTDSKSRLNFLQVLRGPATAYTINEVAVAYWPRQQLAQAVVDALQAGPCHFAEEAAWQARLEELGVPSERHVRIATEGALLGQVIAQGVSPDLVILSDGAEQFNLLAHAACWVHAERPLVRLIPYHEAHRAAIAGVRQQIWELYRALQAYRAQPDPAQKTVLESRFDTLCEQKTVYPSINNVRKEMRQHKADLLRVLECPAVPVHNNGTESIIRVYVQKRKISGSTRSPAGRRCRDTFVSLMKTCRKLGISFWEYLRDRLRGRGQIPRLAELIQQRAAEARAGPNAAAVPR